MVTTARRWARIRTSATGAQTMNTPAVTIVAAWISAETGVGPSIASGSQVCRKSWADLPMAPTNSSRHSRSSARGSSPEEVDFMCPSALRPAPA